jgi:hypothetical protein
MLSEAKHQILAFQECTFPVCLDLTLRFAQG